MLYEELCAYASEMYILWQNKPHFRISSDVEGKINVWFHKSASDSMI